MKIDSFNRPCQYCNFNMINGHGKNHYLLYFTKYLGSCNIIKAIKNGWNKERWPEFRMTTLNLRGLIAILSAQWFYVKNEVIH